MMSKHQLDCDDSDLSSKRAKIDPLDDQNWIETLQQKTLREIIEEMNCEGLIPAGTAKIIALRAKAEIKKRKHEKIDQSNTPWRVNTYTPEEQAVLKKHVKIRVAEVVLEQIKQKIAMKLVDQPIFTARDLFCLDNKSVKMNDNRITRDYVFPLLTSKPKDKQKQYRPKQSVPVDKQRELLQNSILEMLKACYGVTDDSNVDVDHELFNVLGISADSKGILHQIIFTLSNVLKYQGKTIDEIFEEFSLQPPTDSDLYKRFTAKEKKDELWPKRFNSYEVNGKRCTGSTPIYYGKHLKDKREEVRQYKESVSTGSHLP